MTTGRWCATWLLALLLAQRAGAGIADEHLVEVIPLPTMFARPIGITITAAGTVWFAESFQSYIGRYDPRDGKVTEFRLSPTGAVLSPYAITTGPDGNLWFTEMKGAAIGRITPLGELQEFPLPSASDRPVAIANGPDGNLWFTFTDAAGENPGGSIGRITPTGTISVFIVDEPPSAITRGPDAALWFTTPSSLGRITLAGDVRLLPAGGDPRAIAVGPDGALWFALAGETRIGRMTTAGAVDYFSYDSTSPATSITRGPEDNMWFSTEDGAIWRLNLSGTAAPILPATAESIGDLAPSDTGQLWFTQTFANNIGRLNTLAFRTINVPGGAPLGLARGADGTIWYADAGGERIGRIAPNGGLLQFELAAGHTPTGIAVGADGSAWFTNQDADSIGRITPQGDLVEFAIPSPPSRPQDIVLGPDGNFWFTEFDAGSIGRITPQGVVRRFPIRIRVMTATAASPRGAVNGSTPQSITVGPDGNLWFTDSGTNAIGRLTPAGDVVEYPIPTPDSVPWGIAAGWDGNLYFTEYGAGRVARIAPQGVITELSTPVPGSLPQFITLGPDGAMWFTEYGANRLGRIGRDGRITRFDLPDDDSGPSGIVSRGDGRLFYGLYNLSRIGSVDLAAAEPTRTPTSGGAPTPTPTERAHGCTGDCDGAGSVTIDELIAAVNIALGTSAYETCTNADADGDGSIRVNDLVAAVVSALNGCPE